MDKFDDGSSADSNSSNQVYKFYENDSFTYVCMNSSNNNNNNEKMDDANQTGASNQKFTSSMRQDSINSDFSLLTDSMQLNADDRHRNSIDFRPDVEYLLNDNQSNASNEASDSTDNISFVSEDIVENIILMPNNFLSDDESTNSDDVVYAYRGADFEPVPVNGDANADDETDYLEMDFEPDTASEIEPEPNQIEPNGSRLPVLSYSPPKSYEAIPKFNDGTSTSSNIERTSVHTNWPSPDAQNGFGPENAPAIIAGTSDGIDDNNIVNIHVTNNNEIHSNVNDVTSNKSVENEHAQQTHEQDVAQSSYYDNTVSLSTRKYTGTIPKTGKFHIRPAKSKTPLSEAINGNGATKCDLWTFSANSTQKITKNAKKSQRDKPVSSSYGDNLAELVAQQRHVKDKSFVMQISKATRSMSFPNDLPQKGSSVLLALGEPFKRELENDVDQPASVTFDSTYCTIDTIINALEKINVLPNLRVLNTALRDDEEKVAQMNIPEFLIYASKRYCNFKAIISAIEQSCEDVNVKFFAASSETIETVNIPVQAIASRLNTNGSIRDILKIKNKRFHQWNMLGKVVNVVRRFPDMRPDLILHEFISVPQYYRSGVICVSKKESSLNQI